MSVQAEPKYRVFSTKNHPPINYSVPSPQWSTGCIVVSVNLKNTFIESVKIDIKGDKI